MLYPLLEGNRRWAPWMLVIALGAAGSFPVQAQVRQVDGQLILGQSGTTSGALTLMPPDGTGWYHIDNPGGQQIRISGGGRPGQYLYLTIGHPGRVTVHGDLVVTGALQAKSHAAAAPTQGGSRGKADAATPGDVQTLLDRIDQLDARIRALEQQRSR